MPVGGRPGAGRAGIRGPAVLQRRMPSSARRESIRSRSAPLSAPHHADGRSRRWSGGGPGELDRPRPPTAWRATDPGSRVGGQFRRRPAFAESRTALCRTSPARRRRGRPRVSAHQGGAGPPQLDRPRPQRPSARQSRTRCPSRRHKARTGIWEDSSSSGAFELFGSRPAPVHRREAARLERVTGKFALHVEGGQAVYSVSGRCPLGFSVGNASTYYFLTAGHCTTAGSIWYADAGHTTVPASPRPSTRTPRWSATPTRVCPGPAVFTCTRARRTSCPRATPWPARPCAGAASPPACGAEAPPR